MSIYLPPWIIIAELSLGRTKRPAWLYNKWARTRGRRRRRIGGIRPPRDCPNPSAPLRRTFAGPATCLQRTLPNAVGMPPQPCRYYQNFILQCCRLRPDVWSPCPMGLRSADGDLLGYWAGSLYARTAYSAGRRRRTRAETPSALGTAGTSSTVLEPLRCRRKSLCVIASSDESVARNNYYLLNIILWLLINVSSSWVATRSERQYNNNYYSIATIDQQQLPQSSALSCARARTGHVLRIG